VPGVVVTATDPSHYFGSDPKIQVVKKIKGDDANTTPGVRASTPGTLTVTFVVTNTGNVTLDPVTVTDSDIAAGQIVCPTKVLAAGASMTCLATYPAPAAGVQHSDTATVTGTPPLLTDGTRQPDVTDTDDAHAWGDPKPDITITKFLNGLDANTAPGPQIVTGDTVNVSFLVTNSGNTRLDSVTVTDSVVSAASISCPKTSLAIGESMTCTGTFIAPAPLTQHTNTGSVVGTPVLSDGIRMIDLATGIPVPVVRDTDPAYAATVQPGMYVVKKINGQDANTAPGVLVVPGSTMQVDFTVFNIGSTRLERVTVSDDTIPGPITCTPTALDPGQSATCSATYAAPAVGVQHTNTATAQATPIVNGSPIDPITDTDPANAAAANPMIQVVKKINGQDANDATTAVPAVAGATMIVTFEVENTGNTTLIGVTVTDDVIPSGAISCPDSVLDAGETMTCTAEWAAPAVGQPHTDLATVSGTPTQVDGQPIIDPATGAPMSPVDDKDPATTWTPAHPAVTIVKAINGDDADAAPGVSVAAGSPMAVTFLVTNTGDVRLSPIVVTDSDATTISCPVSSLEPGGSTTCTASIPAPAIGGGHVDTAKVVGSPVQSDGSPALGADGKPLDPVSASNSAHAFVAARPGITVVKTINTDDANSAPGVSVVAGAPLAVKFVVTNTGDVRLAPVTLTDDPVDGLSCQVSELAPGASMECTGTLPGLAAGSTHLDTATATGTPVLADGTPVLGVDGLPIGTVQDTDPAYAFAPATSGVSIVKSLNGDDANTAPGVSVAAGSPVTATFVVSNTGTSFLANVTVTDSLATGITCPGAATGTANVIPLLGPAGSGTASVTCSGTVAALAAGATHVNTGSVSGTPTLADGTTPAVGADAQPLQPQTDTDDAYAFAPATSGVTIVKSLNGDDANSAPGVSVGAGAPLSVTFVVSNTGTSFLANVTVTDSLATGITCAGAGADPATANVVLLLGPAGSDTASVTCTGTVAALAPGATHLNTGSVSGTPVLADGSTPALGADGLPLPPPSDTDDAYAFAPATSGVTIVKSLNDDDANSAPGVSVAAGAPLSVTFLVTNTGTAYLANVTVTDSLATGLTCPGADPATPNVIPLLGPAGSDTASVTCTGTVAALAPGAAHLNTGSVSGTPVLADGTTPAVGADGLPLPPPSDTDDAYAFAPATSGVSIVKSLNGDDANTAPGVSVAAGSPVTATFLVSNTGTSFLANVTVTDSLATSITCPGAATGTANVIPLLGPAGSGTASVTCSGTVAALAAGATHVNTGSVSGTPTLADGTTPAVGADGLPLPPPTDTDDAYAFAPATSGVSIVKSLNGDDANTAPGVSVAAGSPVSVTFVVTNTGTSFLANVTVTDSLATGLTCPGAAAATANVIPLLGPAGSGTASVTCSGTVAALAAGATHVDTGSVSGTPVLADGTTPAVGADAQPLRPPSDTDDAYAFAPATSGVSIVKSLNDDDANAAPGVSVAAGSPVTVTFVVSNTGTSFLANVTVTDSLATGITCEGASEDTPNVIPLLGPAGSDTASVTCTGTVAALAPGATHMNTGSVSGTPVLADGSTPALGADGLPLPPPSDTDDAYAFAPATSGVSIVKSLNGDDANTAPGVSVVAGAPVTVTFVVTNTGTSFLANVTVTDSLATGISCEGAAEDTPNVIPLLGPAGSTGSEEEPSAVATCTGMVAALAPGATHLNTGSVSGTPVLADGTTPAVGADGQPLPPSTATDDAHAYAPAHPGIGVVKRINGDDAATAPGVSVPAGSLMMVTFEVTNTGDVRIDPVVLSDSTVTEIRCPAAALDPGEVMTCSANLAAPAVGVQHSNTVTATGSPVLADGTPAVGDDGQPASAPTATDTAYAVSVATSLPQTGANVTGLVGSGLGMLLLGWLLLLASPRRRSARSRRS